MRAAIVGFAVRCVGAVLERPARAFLERLDASKPVDPSTRPAPGERWRANGIAIEIEIPPQADPEFIAFELNGTRFRVPIRTFIKEWERAPRTAAVPASHGAEDEPDDEGDDALDLAELELDDEAPSARRAPRRARPKPAKRKAPQSRSKNRKGSSR